MASLLLGKTGRRGRELAAGNFLVPGSAKPVRYLGFPWQMARWLLSPRHVLVKSDPQIEVLGVIRSTAAIVSLLALKFALQPPPELTVPDVAIYGPWVAEAATLVVGGFALIIIFPLLAPPRLRATKK